MSLTELSNFIITSKYAKYLKTEKRRETWDEITDRSLVMHLKKFDSLPTEDKLDIAKAFKLVRQKKVLQSMRSAHFGGEGVEKKNERAYNCCFLHIYNTRSIEKAFYLLLCGCGCGFGLSKKWIEQFPKVTQDKKAVVTYTVPDTIEGWATSAKLLVDSYLEGNEVSNKRVEFDYSLIRPKGSPISHGGTAPGSEGLALCHQQIRKLLDTLPNDRLRSIDVYDILMHTADAVLSGGIRRAACIALFDKDDYEMLTAKTGSWWIDNPQRQRSNNTVLLNRKEVTRDDFKSIVEHTRQFGEPGFAFVDDMNAGFNPCGEIQFLPIYDGQPAVQFCNLTTINGTLVKSKEDFFKAVEAATIIGTLQASYTDFKFLDDIDRKMTEEEALLGVSIMGYFANPEILLNDEILAEGAKLATEVNERWAKKLNINPAARITCTKPDGTSALAVGSPFSGIHPAHADRYIRRIQVNKLEAPYQFFRQHNPQLCEESVQAALNTDDIISFPVEVSNEEAVFKKDLSAIEHLDIIKSVNKSWVKNGEKNNKKPISHSISCTVLVDDEEWDTVADYLYDNRNYFTTVALLARTGDKAYAQAPHEAMTTEEELVKWQEMIDNIVPVDYTLMVEESDNTARNEEVACAGGVCGLY